MNYNDHYQKMILYNIHLHIPIDIDKDNLRFKAIYEEFQKLSILC